MIGLVVSLIGFVVMLILFLYGEHATALPDLTLAKFKWPPSPPTSVVFHVD